ncbi:ABC transporter substrate-binding protein [Aurantimonas sp. VKM B-3413]|uniref:ABC transporter substrate-binding protein n=1 Tax=Aurantimonas sp. VKM B-3413 TaxID=2779401 RepID=UPI001E4D18CC|nr:ABC transporter substrate-binding protein [Aurantimonas sp. VKM B-3413]MCB8839733.1 ABC transporter substrate-binding protein [Aurantimonas sp. VKM B-3413]
MSTKPLALALLVSAALACPVEAQEQRAADELTIGLAAPLSDSSEILGRQLVAGARAAAKPRVSEDGTQDEGSAASAVSFVEGDTQCSAEGGKAAAETFVKEKAAIVVGFLCTEAIEAALPVLKDAGIPTIDVGVRANRLTDRRERTGYEVWRIAPRSDAEAKAVADYLKKRWKSEPFGLIDDGSIAARSLIDSVRRIVGDAGMQPQTVDNYRPAEEKQFGLVRRLARTGVTRFFIAGDRPDIAIIARDAASNDLDLAIVGGESLFDETSADAPLPDGIVAIGPRNRFPDLEPREPSAEKAGTTGDQALDVPQGYFGPAYAATEIAIAAARRARESNAPLGDILSQGAFDTAFGTIKFDAKGDSNLDLYRVFEWRQDHFVDEAGG